MGSMGRAKLPAALRRRRHWFKCGDFWGFIMTIPHPDLPVDSLDVAGRFSVERMADGYEAANRRVLEAPVAAAYRTVEEPAPVAILSSSVG
jgi:hypothetical protein